MSYTNPFLDDGFGGSAPINGSVTPLSQNAEVISGVLQDPISNVEISSTNANYVIINIAYAGTSVEWLQIGTTTNGGFVDGFSGAASLPVDLANVLDLATGNYTATISFSFYKNDGSNITKSTTIELSVSGPPPIKTEKTNYQLVYNRQTDTLSGDTTVNIENNTAPVQLDFFNNSDLFTLNQDFTTTFTITEESAGKLANSLMLPTVGTANIHARLKNNASEILATFNIELVVIEDDDLVVSPNKLDFALQKGNNETKTATINIVNVAGKSFTVTTPPFVSSNISSGSTSGNIVITTENSDVLEKGIFTGNIVIAYDAKTINIPVTIDNYSFLDIDLEDLNFALDNKILKTQKINAESVFVFIQLQMKFTTGAETYTIVEQYQTAYFQNKTKTDIGKIIHQFFPIFQEHIFGDDGKDFNNKMIYAPVEVSISVQEQDINYNVKHTQIIENLKFFAGNRPKLFPLFTNVYVRRKFANTNFIFSYYSALAVPADFAVNALTSNVVSQNSVQAVFINENKISLAKIEENFNLQTLQIPEGNKNFMLMFINQNLVPEGLILSGNKKQQNDFSQIYDAFQEKAQKYSTEEIGTFTINTGHILEEEIAMVKEIIKSKVCHIKLEDMVLKCFCITDKLPTEEQNLHNFELNFKVIN